MRKLKLAICQMKVCADKKENIEKAVSMLEEAASKGAGIVVLPEMFNCPYDNRYFPGYAEEALTGETVKKISSTARKLEIIVVAGSIPEKEDGNIYNTSFIFGKTGEIIAKHRKVHLFDIEIEGGVRFKESDTLSAGNSITVFDTGYCKIGVAICYDVRFPEMFRLMSLKGAELIVLPAAFNTTTGPAHWELMIRSRAVDCQAYIAAASPARNEEASYKAYGHSMVVNPWGNIRTQIGENEEILFSEINLEEIYSIRSQLPVLKHRRTDVYDLHEL